MTIPNNFSFSVERNVPLFADITGDWEKLFKESMDPNYKKISGTIAVNSPIAYLDDGYRNEVLGQS